MLHDTLPPLRIQGRNRIPYRSLGDPPTKLRIRKLDLWFHRFEAIPRNPEPLKADLRFRIPDPRIQKRIRWGSMEVLARIHADHQWIQREMGGSAGI